jgi:uncharacterized Tic20 family protein
MQPSEDERVLAALSHASIIANVANLAGLLAAALIWTAQRDRSPYVRSHAFQAMIYQGAVIVISIFLVLCWGVCIVLSLLPAAVRPDLYRSSPPNSFWLALVGLVVPVGFGIAATLYGLYGAYRAYRGRSFRYPLAGRVARSWNRAGDQPAAPPIVAPTLPAAPAAVAPGAPAPAETAPLGAPDEPAPQPAQTVVGQQAPAGDEETAPLGAPGEPPPAPPKPLKRRGRQAPVEDEEAS